MAQDSTPLQNLLSKTFGSSSDITKNNRELIQELGKLYQPKTELVKELPDPSTVKDLTEVAMMVNGQITLYKMINGQWQGLVTPDAGGASGS